MEWDTTEDLGTSAAVSLGLELDFIGGWTVSWEGDSLCTHWYTPLSYCCIHWDRFMKAWSYVLQCFSWWYTDVRDPIELQQSQGLLSMTPHRRQEQCCAMRGLHTIVSYHCRHCTDLWDWIGSQGLLFPWPHILSCWCCRTIGSLWGHDRVLAIEDVDCHFERQFKIWQTVLKLWEFKTQWSLALDSVHFYWMQCDAFQSLHLRRIKKLIRRWNLLQFTRNAQARCRSKVIAKCTKTNTNTCKTHKTYQTVK